MTRALVIAAMTVAAATTSWTEPRILSDTAIALGPVLSMSSSGNALAVWDGELGPDCAQSPASLTCAHIVSVATRNGQTGGWSGTDRIARPGIGARPRVALNDAGRAAVIWVHDIGRDRVVQATYRTGANERFPNPDDLSAAVLEVRNHDVALDAAGNVVVVWAERHDQEFEVAAEIRFVASGTWGPPVVLSRGAVAHGPALAVTPQGDAFVLWVERAEVQVAHADVARGAWDAPVALSGPGAQTAGEPVVAADAAGDVVAAWSWLDRPGGATTVQTAYKPAGRAWAGAALDNGAAHDVAIAPDGTAAVTFAGANGQLAAAFRPPGGPWSAAERIAAGGTDSHIALSRRGDALVLFRQASDLFSALRPASVRVWQPAERLSGGEPTSVDIGLGANGDGATVWNLRSGESLPVLTATLRAAAWEPTLSSLRRPAIRGNARVGGTLACDRGDWAGTIPIRYAYAWLRNARPRGSGRTYRVRRTDLGTRLACRVTATNGPKTVAAVSRSVRVR